MLISPLLTPICIWLCMSKRGFSYTHSSEYSCTRRCSSRSCLFHYTGRARTIHTVRLRYRCFEMWKHHTHTKKSRDLFVFNKSWDLFVSKIRKIYIFYIFLSNFRYDYRLQLKHRLLCLLKGTWEDLTKHKSVTHCSLFLSTHKWINSFFLLKKCIRYLSFMADFWTFYFNISIYLIFSIK